MATERTTDSANGKSSNGAKQCCSSEQGTKETKRAKVTNKPDYDQYGSGKYSDSDDDFDDCLD